LVKSFSDAQPDFGDASAPVEDQRYEDGRLQLDDDVVVVVVVRDVVVVVREVVVVLDVVELVELVVRDVVVVVVVPPVPPSAVQLTLTWPALPAPMNPNEAEAPAPSAPFQDSFFTDTVPELPVATPPHRDCTLTPDGSVIETVQPVMALLPACTVTPPWKPPGHVPAVA
jgi:hypothetical protein